MPQTVLAQGQADFAIAWVPKALAHASEGAEITDIAQIFQRSGTLQVSWKDADITTVEDLEGKKVGNWGFGNEFELFAGMTKAGLDPASDVTLVQQQFDMQALLNREIDAAQAMTYNEYAQVLEAKNPDTGELYTPDGLQRHQLERRRHGDAAGRHLGRSTERLDDAELPGHARQLPEGVDEGLGVLPGQRRGVPRHRGGGRAPSWARATSCGR